MIRSPKAKWIAPLVLTGALLAGGTAAIAAETWNSSDEDSPVDLPFRPKASQEDMPVSYTHLTLPTIYSV